MTKKRKKLRFMENVYFDHGSDEKNIFLELNIYISIYSSKK